MLCMNVYKLLKVKLFYINFLKCLRKKGKEKKQTNHQRNKTTNLMSDGLVKIHCLLAFFIFLMHTEPNAVLCKHCFWLNLQLFAVKIFLHLHWAPSRKGDSFRHVISVFAATAELNALQMFGGTHSSGSTPTVLWDALQGWMTDPGHARCWETLLSDSRKQSGCNTHIANRAPFYLNIVSRFQKVCLWCYGRKPHNVTVWRFGKQTCLLLRGN